MWTGEHGTGWRRVDLTTVIPERDPVTGQPASRPAAQTTGASARAAQRATRPWIEQALFRTRLWYEFVESRWDRWAIGYNSEVQGRFLGWLGLEDFGGWGYGIGLMVGGMAVLLGVVLLAWLAPRLRDLLRRSPAERAYRRLLAACARAGLPRLAAEGPRDHAARVCAAHPPMAAAIRDGVEAWLRLHYGGAATAEDLALLQAAVVVARRLPAAAALPPITGTVSAPRPAVPRGSAGGAGRQQTP